MKRQPLYLYTTCSSFTPARSVVPPPTEARSRPGQHYLTLRQHQQPGGLDELPDVELADELAQAVPAVGGGASGQTPALSGLLPQLPAGQPAARPPQLGQTGLQRDTRRRRRGRQLHLENSTEPQSQRIKTTPNR